MCSWYTHVCLFVPNCSLLKSFRIQNWRRGWDPECKQSVHMAVIIGNLGPFDERSEKFSDYADRFENMLRRMTSTMTKKWMFFWLLLVQTLTSCWRICAVQIIRIQRRLHGWRSFCRDTTNLLPLLLLKDTSSELRHKERARVYQNSSIDWRNWLQAAASLNFYLKP